MSKKNRKKHETPRGFRPPGYERKIMEAGNAYVMTKRPVDNDNGQVIDGRMYVYHPTKGWRNRSARHVPFNLTRMMAESVRA